MFNLRTNKIVFQKMNKSNFILTFCLLSSSVPLGIAIVKVNTDTMIVNKTLISEKLVLEEFKNNKKSYDSTIDEFANNEAAYIDSIDEAVNARKELRTKIDLKEKEVELLLSNSNNLTIVLIFVLITFLLSLITFSCKLQNTIIDYNSALLNHIELSYKLESNKE
jgi:cytochrome c-type biogenesis protein CcmH/NrfG